MGTTLEKVQAVFNSKNAIANVMSSSNAGLDVPTKFSNFATEIQTGFNRLQISPLTITITDRNESSQIGSPARPNQNGKMQWMETPSHVFSIDSSIEYIGKSGLMEVGRATTSITKVDLSHVLAMGGGNCMLYSFINAGKQLTEVDLSGLVCLAAGSLPSSFTACKGLKKVYLNNIGKYRYPRAAKQDAPGDYTYRPLEINSITGTFKDCTALEEVHLDNSPYPMPLTFSSTYESVYPFYNTNSTFKIIVPDGTVDAWKAETGWSVYADHFISVSDFEAL